MDGLENVTWGRSRLNVAGKAHFHTRERMTMLAGINNRYERVWNGAIMRLAGMEGVICAGFYMRILFPISMTLSAICSGDVYGGSVRASMVRLNMAGMGYRSVEACAWATGLHHQSTGFTIEPILGTPTQHQPAKNIFRKIGRLMMALCPFLDLAVGVFSFLFQLLRAPFDAAMAGYNKLRGIKKKPKPPSGPPRSRIRTAGVTIKGANIHAIT